MTPTIFIIFGITGDLAQRKLLPALLSLYVRKLLPKKFAIVGFSRRFFTREEFRQYVRDHMNVKPGQYYEEDIKHFLDHVSYEQGKFDSEDSYQNLARKLQLIDDSFHQCSNKLFHLSVSPSFYETILERLAQSGLTIPCDDNVGWTRVLVEKPFGNDIETARQLDAKLASLFDEKQIFRIDHYLAKEALQNMLVFRFSNSLFEPLWNAEHIEQVHIKLLEKIDVEGRGVLYEGLGALKDVGQNHILQMFALIAMEKPKSFDADAVRTERARAISSLIAFDHDTIVDHVVRGQYDGYRSEAGVASDSDTETYFRVEACVDTKRWEGVPFYLESGKALYESRSEIDIYFKNHDDPEKQNVLTFRIQPDEGIKIRFWVKTPGFGMQVEQKTLKFKYSDFPATAIAPDAYERVIYDAFLGDQTLFTSTDEVLAAWNFITPILTHWKTVPLTLYKKGAREV